MLKSIGDSIVGQDVFRMFRGVTVPLDNFSKLRAASSEAEHLTRIADHFASRELAERQSPKLQES